MLVLGLLFYSWLGSRSLAEPDEGRYTEIAREMTVTGDYVTPRLNSVKYFEKPPLVYWLNAIALNVAGISEFAARFWCATFALVGGLLVYFAGCALHDRLTGIWAAIVLSTSGLYYVLSRVLVLDLVVAVLIAATLFSFLFGLRSPPGSRRRWLFWAGYAAMALATLTKGLIGIVFPCAVVGLWVLLLNQWRSLRPFHPWTGGALFLALALPWHIAVARANPDFLTFYFIHEHLQRFVTKIHDRVEPWWYFLPVLGAGLLPWTAFAIPALTSSFRTWWRDRQQHAAIWFLLIWIGFIVAFFSASQSKLAPYVMPVFPAVAVLVAPYLARVWRTGQAPGFRPAAWFVIVFFCLAAVAVVIAPLGDKHEHLVSVLLPWRITAGLALAAGAVSMTWAQLQHRPGFALVAMTLSCSAFFVLLNPITRVLDLKSTKSVVEVLKERLRDEDDVFCLGDYYQDVPVYLERFVSVVAYEGELAFGIRSEPERAARLFIDRETFESRWRQAVPAYAIVEKRSLDQWFDLSRRDAFALAENTRYILLANREP